MKMIQINRNIKTTIKHWKYISKEIHEPQNKNDYNKLANILDKLLDIVGEDETNELMGLIDVIGHMLTTYDERRSYQIKNVSGIGATGTVIMGIILFGESVDIGRIISLTLIILGIIGLKLVTR